MRSSTRSPPSQNASNRDDESESTAAPPHVGTNHDGSRIILNLDVRAKRNECVFPRYPKWVIAFLQKKTNEPEDAWVVLTFLECFLLVVVPGVMLFFVDTEREEEDAPLVLVRARVVRHHASSVFAKIHVGLALSHARERRPGEEERTL